MWFCTTSLSEPNEFETSEKKDIDQFVGIIQSSLRLNIKVSKCFRARRIQADHPHLLIVTLNDLQTKIELLCMSCQLRSVPEWKVLYINPDLTHQQKERREENLDKNWLQEDLLGKKN